jgi:hypothetical protein
MTRRERAALRAASPPPDLARQNIWHYLFGPFRWLGRLFRESDFWLNIIEAVGTLFFWR